MHIVKIISWILLAIYLIFQGLITLLGLQIGGFALAGIGLIALVAGLLMLISLGACRHHHDHPCDPNDKTGIHRP